MSNTTSNIDYNEAVMQLLVYGFVIILIFSIFLFTVNAIINGPKPDEPAEETESNAKSKAESKEGFAVSDEDLNTLYAEDKKTPILESSAVIKTVIKPRQGQLMDVVLNRQRVPIDYWIFRKIGETEGIDDRVVVYMTDLQDSTFSNQNARRLIHEILTRGRCGSPNDGGDLCMYTMPELCSDRRVLINWIFNHSWLTSARSKRYRMYNLYTKYFPMPLDADDYDAPLLEDAKPYSTDNPVSVSKSDIQAANHLDVPKTTKVMCADQLFVEQDPDFSLYCNGSFLQWNGERSNKYHPVVARYYMVVVTDPEPVFSYTGDGLVTLNESTQPLDHENRFEYTANSETVQEKRSSMRVERLSDLIKVDPLISWRRTKNRIDQKLSRLGELMVNEHRQESMVDGIQELLNRSYIDMYQTFGVDFVIRDGEPYILKITASPPFQEIGTPVGEDMMESLVERTKLMLKL